MSARTRGGPSPADLENLSTKNSGLGLTFAQPCDIVSLINRGEHIAQTEIDWAKKNPYIGLTRAVKYGIVTLLNGPEENPKKSRK
jgi:hypothetical protein